MHGFADKVADQFYDHDNTAGVDANFRKDSHHIFFVQQTSMFHIHLNTLDSDVRVRFVILDHEQEIVYAEEEF